MKTFKTGLLFTTAILCSIGFYAFKYRETKPTTITQPFALVELFTSEGCSSCPPADDLVAKIVKEDKDKPVYVLGFHVDYWNRLGWKDQYSKAEFSQRQRRYAEWLRLSSVYTPQVVVNGKREFVGSDANALHTAIQAALQRPVKDVIALSDVRFTGDALTLQYHATENMTNRSLLIAFVQRNAQTKVMSGENGGHTLNHVNIVRDLKSIDLKMSGSVETIKLPAGFSQQTWQVVAFVQNTLTGEVLSAQNLVNSGA